MKVRKLGLLAAVAAVAAVPAAAEAGSARDRATGGGQVLLDPNSPPTTGALDTVAFTAQAEHGQNDGNTADGQVQVNRRSGEAAKFHGEVECLVVIGNKAYMNGHSRDGVYFELFAIDGGAGEAERGTDQTIVWIGPETDENTPDQETVGNFTPPEEEECGIEEDPTSKREALLTRGNNQVYDAP